MFELLLLKLNKTKALVGGLVAALFLVSISLLFSYSKLQFRYSILEQKHNALILQNRTERTSCGEVLAESNSIKEKYSTLRSELKALTNPKNKEITLNEAVITPIPDDSAARLLCRAKLTAPGLCNDPHP